MIKTIALIATILILWLSPSCNRDEDKKDTTTQTPSIGQDRLFAIVLDTTGKKTPTIVLRAIQKSIVFDSITKKDKIVYDTVYGVERAFPALDSLKRPIKDSLGNTKIMTGYFLIGKDSVNTNVCGQPIDSLIKK